MEYSIEQSDSALVFFAAALIIAVLLAIGVSAAKWAHIFITETGAVLIFGLFIGAISFFYVKLFSTSTEFFLTPVFFSDLFYKVCLPPIIFNAGFTMKKRNFFSNFGTILTLAIFVTVFTCVIYGVSMYAFATHGLIGGTTNFIDHLIGGAIISACDTVAVLALFLELNVDGLLYNLVFGESVLNDAVSIVLFRTLQNYSGGVLSWMIVGKIVGSFFIIFIGSLIIGAIIAFFSAFVVFQLKKYRLSSTWEVSLILLFAYLSYASAEMLKLSGIFSIFICGVIMAHYDWYSIAPRSRSALYICSGTISYFAETGCYLSLGITLFSRDHAFERESWNTPYILSSFLFSFVARCLSVGIIMPIINIFRKEKIGLRMILVQMWAGLKGAVAIILAFTHMDDLLVTSVYILVLFSTLVMATLTKPLLKLLNIKMGDSSNMRPIEETEILINSKKSEKKTYIHRLWRRFDDSFMKKYFGGRTPTADAFYLESPETSDEDDHILHIETIADREVIEPNEQTPLRSEHSFRSRHSHRSAVFLRSDFDSVFETEDL